MADKVELLMKIEMDGGTAIEAESTLGLDPRDTLTTDFRAGFFFQITDFTFSVGLQDDSGGPAGGESADPGRQAASGTGPRRLGLADSRPALPYGGTRASLERMQQASQGGGAGNTPAGGQKQGKAEGKSAKTGSNYTRWRAGAAGAHYPLDVEPIGFTRTMDKASSRLLQAVLKSETFAKASIVRRIATGDLAGQSYLRLDFEDVLITNIDLDDKEEVIEEKFKFICRGASVQYRPQNDDGTLGNAIQGKWPLSKASA